MTVEHGVFKPGKKNYPCRHPYPSDQGRMVDQYKHSSKLR